MSKALGLIEVNGYIAAIEAADTALKAANVTLLGVEKVTAGIVTVKVTGDVGAVKAAVEAAEVSTQSLGLLRNVHVIARVHDDVLKIIPEMNTKTEDTLKQDTNDLKCINNIDSKEKKSEVTTEEERRETEEVTCDKGSQEENIKSNELEKKDYSSMKVEELRKLVRSLKIPDITNKQIKFAKKDVLIDIITKYYEEGVK
ncbi:BMC domain-containing protein [Clostridium frigidicarnis]|uniref:Carboxysome shell and ethanolamine utilization microcompartment protein CcmL/EutN n=1 Tax=Clostridium frigidicarnis TaxID=84698 RepID=A0A1I0ZRJ0_9CLOT|nr:BMC domain-containing protein [Clostridium frigidicarnis]SFB28409.1 Carboxysome shell and ethanolamine utilization microcompartment protein CcmL/EutN [Clostridium frigidicarnis]